MKGAHRNIRRNRRRKLTPRRLGGRNKILPTVIRSKRMERYREAKKLESVPREFSFLVPAPVDLLAASVFSSQFRSLRSRTDDEYR